jgi:hypothetical protein
LEDGVKEEIPESKERTAAEARHGSSFFFASRFAMETADSVVHVETG